MKLKWHFIILAFLLLSFSPDEQRTDIEKRYNALLPSLKSEPLKAIKSLETLLVLADKNLEKTDTLLANIYFSTGKIYCDNGIKITKGIELYEKCLAIRKEKLPPNSIKIAQTAHNLALILRQLGNTQQAFGYETLALNIKSATAKNKADSTSLLRSIQELAVIQRFQGNIETAFEVGKKAEMLARTLNDSFFIVQNQIFQGSCRYLVDSFSQATQHYQTALSLVNDMLKRTPSVLPLKKELAASLNNLGVTYGKMGQMSLANQYLSDALIAYDNLFAATNDSTVVLNSGSVLTEQGRLAFEQKDYPKAIAFSQKALTRMGNRPHPYATECYTLLAEAYRKTGLEKEALEAYNMALKGSENIIFPEMVPAFIGKSQFFYNKNDLKNSLTTCDEGNKAINKLMRLYDADGSKYNLSKNAHQLYEIGIKASEKLWKSTNEMSYLDKSLNFMESNKAIVLLANLKDNKAKNFAGIPDSVLNIERNLKAEIAYWEKQTLEAPDSLKQENQLNLIDAKAHFNGFIKTLETDYPKYTTLKYQENDPLSIAAIQKDLDTNSLVLECFMGDSSLFTLAISKDKSVLHISDDIKTLKNDFNLLRRSLSDERFIADSSALAESQFLKTSYVFFKTLLDTPLSIFNQNQTIKRLRIIPDGFLGYIPFELLTTQLADTWKGSKVPYVLQQYAVSYAYSLRTDNSGSNAIQNSNFGGFGIEYNDTTLRSTSTPQSSRGNKLSRLAFADDEVKNIHSLLGKGTIFLNDDATKFTFMQNATNYSILHLAMHGAVDEKNPLNSALIFSKKDSSDDNLLRGYDLYAMQLRSGLAVLSACNTGNGSLQRGEGVMSLARAFAFAGCPSTVVSLWSIPDESTSKVMLAFYKNLKNGDKKDIALQKAKLEYLNSASPQYSIPNYWGATVIIGDVEAMDFKEWYQKPAFLGLAIVGLFVLLILIFNKNKK